MSIIAVDRMRITKNFICIIIGFFFFNGLAVRETIRRYLHCHQIGKISNTVLVQYTRVRRTSYRTPYVGHDLRTTIKYCLSSARGPGSIVKTLFLYFVKIGYRRCVVYYNQLRYTNATLYVERGEERRKKNL